MAVVLATLALVGAAASFCVWKTHGRARHVADVSAIQEQLAACGADVHAGRWTRMPTNLDDAELVQAAQLKMRAILLEGGDSTGLDEISRAWVKLPLYRPPADRAQRLSASECGFLLGNFGDEWARFKAGGTMAVERGTGVWSCDEAGVRRWASARMQTVYRTVLGATKNHAALAAQLATELPGLSADELSRLMAHKLRTVWALQTWGTAGFAGQEVVDALASS